MTILLNEVLAWVRTQPGTSSLRAMLYMDEVFGYFPPTAKPPSKTPMLTLLKQARAYGLGVVLATQNPVDLDYKGLSNAGTWFLGRLQTERDKARVLDGLEGASADAGAAFDRKRMEPILSGLGSRVFLMNNVHEDQPVVFQTRWALSYLRGPLTREQIARLTAEHREAASRTAEADADSTVEPETATTTEPGPTTATLPEPPTAADDADSHRVVLPPDVEEGFVPPRVLLPPGQAPLYRPVLLGTARMHFGDRKADVDRWETVTLTRPAESLPDARRLGRGRADRPAGRRNSNARRWPAPGSRRLDPAAGRAKNYDAWSKQLKAHLYAQHRLTLWECPDPAVISRPDESQRDFRLRVSMASREQRDAEGRQAPRQVRAEARRPGQAGGKGPGPPGGGTLAGEPVDLGRRVLDRRFAARRPAGPQATQRRRTPAGPRRPPARPDAPSTSATTSARPPTPSPTSSTSRPSLCRSSSARSSASSWPSPRSTSRSSPARSAPGNPT